MPLAAAPPSLSIDVLQLLPSEPLSPSSFIGFLPPALLLCAAPFSLPPLLLRASACLAFLALALEPTSSQGGSITSAGSSSHSSASCEVDAMLRLSSDMVLYKWCGRSLGELSSVRRAGAETLCAPRGSSSERH